MPFFKTKNQNLESRIQNPNTLPPDTLLPLEKIISLSKKNGVKFGSGNAKERIRYFIKLGILPHAVRKVSTRLPTTDYRLPTTGASAPIAHLPYWTVDRLTQIQELSEKGLTIRKIAQNFANSQKRQNAKAKNAKLPANEAADFQKPIVREIRSINLFPKFGVSEKAITKKFKEQETRIQNIIANQLAPTSG